LYGFAIQAGLGAAVWTMCRLSGTRLEARLAVLLGAWAWNVGVFAGVVGILFGDSTGFETLEMPGYAVLILFAAYILIVLPVLVAFRQRRRNGLSVSQWYLLGALFSFPWLFGAAYLLTTVYPLRGVLQAAAQAWYAHGLFGICLGFLGLGVLFHLIPEKTGQPVPSRRLAAFGFWTLALFGSLGGLQEHWGGPFPAWMTVFAVAACVLTVIPVLAVAANLMAMLRGQRTRVRASLVLSGARVATVAYVAPWLLLVANALPPAVRLTNFTLVPPGLKELYLHGFFTVTMLAAANHILPILIGRTTADSRNAKLGLGLVVTGLLARCAALTCAGGIQGFSMIEPYIPMDVIASLCRPLVGAALVGTLMLMVGCVVWMLDWFAPMVATARAWLRRVTLDLVKTESATAEGKA
jgi:cytochrome c oxidase cbb3-type subunit 1